MKAASPDNSNMTKWTRRLAAPFLALVLVGSVVTYECVKPSSASAAAVPAPAPAAAALDANSVSALTAIDKAMETLAARVTPAVVNVTVVSKTKPESASNPTQDEMQQFFGQNGQNEQNGPFGQFFGPHMQMQPHGPQIEHGLGSGVVISPDGYIVTNNHVIEGAVDIRVTTSDRRVLKAKLVGADPITDLAVLKVSEANLASVPWGDSTQVRPGQTVLAFGNPYGFRFTVTRGIVSAINRSNPDSNRSKPGEFIQTDAAINPGNSGGPLIDASGNLIGINTAIVSYSPSGGSMGIGFAIPVSTAKMVLEQIVKSGSVTRGWIGVEAQAISPGVAESFKLGSTRGALIAGVLRGGPADKAGVKPGDVLVEVQGKPVADPAGMLNLIAALPPGQPAKLKLRRQGQDVDATITVGRRPKPQARVE